MDGSPQETTLKPLEWQLSTSWEVPCSVLSLTHHHAQVLESLIISVQELFNSVSLYQLMTATRPTLTLSVTLHIQLVEDLVEMDSLFIQIHLKQATKILAMRYQDTKLTNVLMQEFSPTSHPKRYKCIRSLLLTLILVQVQCLLLMEQLNTNYIQVICMILYSMVKQFLLIAQMKKSNALTWKNLESPLQFKAKCIVH